MRQQIVNQLQKGKTKAALEHGEQILGQLKDLYYNWISVQSSFRDSANQKSTGTIAESEYTLQLNRTNARILELVKSMDNLLTEQTQSQRFNDLQEELQSILADQYKILDVIRDGALTVLYRAQEVYGDDYVAIRVLKSETPYFQSTAFDEATRMKRVNHRNIISIIGYSPKASYPRYVVLEHTNGSTLETLVETHGPRPTNEIIHILTRLTDALYYLHKRKIFNADLRPDRIIIDDESEPMFSPFIVFRNNNENNYAQIIANLKYMSYERLSVKDYENFGPVSNQFSLGNIAYLLHTGKPLFEGDSLIHLIKGRMQFENDSEYFEKKLAALDGHPQLIEVIRKLLSKHRYTSMLEVKRALLRISLDEDPGNILAQESFIRATSFNPQFAQQVLQKLQDKGIVEVPEEIGVALFGQRIQHTVNLLIATNPSKNYLTKVLKNPALASLIVDHRDDFLELLIDIISKADYLWDKKTETAWRATLTETFMEVSKPAKN